MRALAYHFIREWAFSVPKPYQLGVIMPQAVPILVMVHKALQVPMKP